jgi:hypothetical protein
LLKTFRFVQNIIKYKTFWLCLKLLKYILLINFHIEINIFKKILLISNKIYKWFCFIKIMMNIKNQDSQNNNFNDNYYFSYSNALEEILLTNKPNGFTVFVKEKESNKVVGKYRFLRPDFHENAVVYKTSYLKSNKSNQGIPKQLIIEASNVLQEIAKFTNSNVIHSEMFDQLEHNHKEKLVHIQNHFRNLGYLPSNNKFVKTYSN